MQITGMVMEVRPWDFKGSDGEQINMASCDLYDETAKLIQVEARLNDGPLPTVHGIYTGTVSKIKDNRNGDGKIYVTKELLPVMARPVSEFGPPQFTPPPPPTFGDKKPLDKVK